MAENVDFFGQLFPIIERRSSVAIQKVEKPEEVIERLYGAWYGLRYQQSRTEHGKSLAEKVLIPSVQAARESTVRMLQEQESSDLSLVPADNTTAVRAQLEGTVRQRFDYISRRIEEIKQQIGDAINSYVHSPEFYLTLELCMEKGADEGTLTFRELSPFNRMALFYLFNNKGVLPLSLASSFNDRRLDLRNIEKYIPDVGNNFHSYFPGLGCVGDFYYNHHPGIPLLVTDVAKDKEYVKYFSALFGLYSRYSSRDHEDRIVTKRIPIEDVGAHTEPSDPTPKIYACGHFRGPKLSSEQLVQVNAHILATFTSLGLRDKIRVEIGDYLKEHQ